MKLPIIAALALLPILTLKGAIVVEPTSPDDDIAKAYLGGGAFGTGPNPLMLGNINSLATRQLGIIKFDITQFAGQTVTEAIFNFDVDYFNNDQGLSVPFQIDVSMLNYDKTAAAFVVGDLTTENVTLMGSFNVGAEGLMSWDATSAVQSAVSQGFDYVSLRFANITVEAGPSGLPAFVGFNTASGLNITVTAVPEPSVVALALAGSLGCGLVRFMRRKNH